MRQWLTQVLENTIGNHREYTLEHRLFNSISLLNGVTNIGGAFFMLSLHNFLILFFLHFITGILFLSCWYYSRYHHRYQILYWPFVTLILAFLSINWFSNAGSNGGAHYYLIVAVIIAIILAKKTSTYLKVFGLSSIVTLSLFAAQYFHPEWITNHANMTEKYGDLALNYSFVQIFSGILVLILSKNLNQERKKSDQLLLNILPAPIAEELKRYDRAIPKHYNSATVLFTDLVGFTQIAETMTPSELVHELDYCFKAFDQVMQKHGIEKIKTIGDAYMAVGGIPTENKTHAYDCVLAGLEIQDFMKQLKKEKEAKGEPCWELRLGIHTGGLVAGVIGTQKFAYDVWGDTVNLASRMESSGETGKVNISSATYEQIKDFFKCEYRGKIKAKNKGDIDMYFVHKQQTPVNKI
ncbi:MAG: adenylate cyclase [bacterium]|jgi:adenylate cyclase